MKFRDIVENVEITNISSEGKSIGRHDGLVVFVKDGVPGDTADIQITHKRRRFVEGQIHKLHTPSPYRSKPFCEHFGTCGGCKWQHMSYGAQLKYKQDYVAENLKKISGLVLPEIQPIIGSEATTNYRNKLEYTFSNKRWLTKEEVGTDSVLERNALGFHIPKRFDKILDINVCHLQADPSNKIRLAVKEYAIKNGLTFFDIREQHGLLRNLIIRTSTSGELMVILQFFETAHNTIRKLMTHLKEQFSQITSLNYIINQKKNETFQDQELICFSGMPYIQEKMDDLTFRIGPKSFYQTNSKQAYKLYQVIETMAEFKGDEMVYDLYTGTGTIANFIARKAKKVIGIEYVPEAIEDAKVNSRINKIFNTEFLTGDIKKSLNEAFVHANGHPNLVITDPPRVGMHADVIAVLNRVKPFKIIYVSCNPATQARDIQLLSSIFKVVKIQPIDMFPQTQHVECVILLELRK